MRKAWCVTNRRLLWWHGLAVLVLCLDQLSKAWAVYALVGHRQITIFPGFTLRLAFNPGAAFSFLAAGSGWQRWFLIGFAMSMLLLILLWLRAVLREPVPDGRMVTGLGLLFGGAVGNLIDRIQTGRVIDFIQWYYQDWYWPTFNIADMAISCGVFLMAFSLWRSELPKQG